MIIDFIIGGIVTALVITIIVRGVIKAKKGEDVGCGCGCSSCAKECSAKREN
jgi:hypothetical protein